MNADELEKLLQSREHNILDFKGSMYQDLRRANRFDFSNPRGTNGKGYLDLVKDVLSMANTPRTSSAYIVLGVGNSPNQPNRRIGITDPIDDNDIQNHLRHWCDPVPMVQYYDVRHLGKTFGVIEIFPDRARGPFFIKSALSSAQARILANEGRFLEPSVIYFRRGSTNDFARPNDAEYITRWFAAHDEDCWQNWDVFKQACHYFGPSRHYILIAGPLSHLSSSELVSFSHIDWTAVFDFDPNSDSTGLLHALSDVPLRRSITRVARGEQPSLNPDLGIHWYFARGIQGRLNTILSKDNDWLSWKRMYGNDLELQFKRLSAAISPNLVTFVVVWSDLNLMKFLQTTIDATTGFASADYVVVTPSMDQARNYVADELHPTLVEIPAQQLCSGLTAEFAQQVSVDSDTCFVPSQSGAPVRILPSKERWLAEELEIVHLGLHADNPGDEPPTNEFLRGAIISWSELDLQKDAERDKTSKLEQRVRFDLTRRETVRVQLYHKPGAGGTTVARRTLWGLHTSYPCVVLRRGDQEHIRETGERLAYISTLTGLPVLLLIDSAQVPERLVDDLFSIVRATGTPVVMLLTSRRADLQTEQKRSFQLDLTLTNSELPRFIEKFSLENPTQAREIRAIRNSQLAHERTAFSFGITAYGKDFRGIKNYVRSRISKLTQRQTEIIVYLAMAHLYAQRGIPGQAFANLLELPLAREVRFEQVFQSNEDTLDILINEKGDWRTIHVLIAQEILEQLLTPANGDPLVWKQQLSHWAKKLIVFCRGESDAISESLLELLRRIFVYRDNQDYLGRESTASIEFFARLIQDIPSHEGRLEIFRELTEAFPKEAHFWAHLGRFLASVMHHYDEALSANQRAIDLQSEDHVLWHMQGMIYRYQMTGLMDENGPLENAIELAERASECFAESRRLKPDSEHGYISEAQLLVRLLNYAGKQANGSVMQYIRQTGVDPFLRNSFDQIETLLAQVRSNREGESASTFETRVRAELHSLYGDPQQALQIWDNLLVRNDVYRPSIRRQIVYTLLDRNNSWTGLQQSSHDRIINLLQDNLDEHPNNDRDLRLWLQAVRYASSPPSIESLIERVSYWKTNSNSLDATYYLYVLNSLRALEGLQLERANAARLIEECGLMARYRRNRLRSFEWYGKGIGIKGLIHQTSLGEWDQETNFWKQSNLLARVDGVITRITGNEAGQIEVMGLPAFFVPGSRITSNENNRRVNFLLGFSYTGLRAWDVALS